MKELDQIKYEGEFERSCGHTTGQPLQRVQIEFLLSVIDAYREVARKILGPLITTNDMEWIDAEAARIMKEKGGV